MKNLLSCTSALFFIALLSWGCNKGNNSYTTTDHTVGMIAVRSWSGTSGGFYKGDTAIGTNPDSVWALHFARVITDTSFSVQKINGFALSVLGYMLDYQSTDSLTTQTVLFDSDITGTQTAVLTYYYLKDSMTFQLSVVFGYNTPANQYYQTNMFLHTNHS